ncbi:MAG TPA: glycosyltransferase family 4 protein [Thermoplasmata archaeon]|nr:glycosyltransferase family 4 protein [Thermoplasmata archaeon]
MKILLMAPWGDREIGGLSSHLLSLEKVIALAGHESSLASHEAIPRTLQESLWLVVKLWPGSRLQAMTAVVEILHGLLALREAIRGDTRLIHAHEPACLPAARWISRFVGAPVVLTVHSQYALGDIVAGYLRRGTRDAKFAWALEKYAFENADFVFTVTTRLRSFVLAEANVDPAKVMVRLNFVDTAEFAPRNAAEASKALRQGGVPLGTSTKGGHRIVLYSGRLSPRKGVDYLIRAARIVIDKDPNVRFLVTGDGPQFSDLKRLRAALGLDDYVTFLGKLDSALVKYVYNVADVVVLPSVTIEGVEEGTPMSALEAMASGVPVVCSAVGGLAEIVADGDTGYLVPEGSVERLADRILLTLEHDQTALIDRAMRYVRERRSLESYAKELTSFLVENQILPGDRRMRPPAFEAARSGGPWMAPVLKARRAASYARATYGEYFRHRQWGVGLAAEPIHRFLESDFHPEVRWIHASGGDEYLADPFGRVQFGRLQVVCERYRRDLSRGSLVTFEWPEDTDTPDAKVVLPLPGHVSYPFLLESEGHVYCVPETSQAGEVALYRADSFPDRWTKVRTLLGGFAGVDSTICRFDDRWWIFSMNVNEPDRKLHLWYADRLEGPWTPHLRNPVLDTPVSARPAGTPFLWKGNLYRPAQDCSRTYGGRVAINRVDELTPSTFRESVVSFVEPDPNGPYPLGLHTLSAAGEVTLIDGFRNVFSRTEFRRRLTEGPRNRRKTSRPT